MTESRNLLPGIGKDTFGAMHGDERVIAALGRVLRHRFVPEERAMSAYLDVAIPIGSGRRCPRPSTVLALLSAGCVGPGRRVLVFETGTGYVSAVAAEVGAEVDAVEPSESLRAAASAALDGRARLHDALPDEASTDTWDAIIVCGAAPRVPRALTARLSADGVLVCPVGEGHETQLFTFTRGARGFVRHNLGPIDIGPLATTFVAEPG